MKTSGKSWARYIDKSIKAKKFGYRKSSETGERYYEDRPNHSDSDPKSKYAKGGAVSKSEKEKLSNMAYQLQNCSDSWISKNHGKFVEMQNEYKKQFKKVYGHNNYADPNTMAKGGKMASIKKKYEQNEDDNYHSENVILLAKNFGDANDLKEAKRILALHNKEGHLSTENGKKRLELHLKLIAKARKEMAKENVSFAKGGMFEHGLKIGDKITGRNGLNKIEGYNKEMREIFITDLDKGKREFNKYAKGGGVLSKYTITFKNSKGQKEYLNTEAYNKAEALKVGKFLEKQNNQFSKGGFKAVSVEEKMAKGGKTKKGKQDPPIVRGYFEDEAIDYAKGGKMATGGSTDDDTPKIYVADLNAYNNGRLVGEWVDLSDFDNGEEVMEKLGEIVNKWKQKYGEDHEEWAIHDYENFSRSLYSEYMGEKDFDKVIQVYKVSRDKDIPADVLGDIMREYEPDNLEEWIDEHYEGQFDSDTDLAYHYVDNLGGVEQLGEETLGRYFDYESFGRDLAYDYGDYDGHYFRRYAKGGKMGKSYDLKKYVFNTNWSYSIGGL